MKKLILLLAFVTLILTSCENKSGRRADIKRIYTIEFTDSEDNVKEYIYADKDSAYSFVQQLDSERVWNKMTVDTLIKK